jgi:hypothetical protein
MLSLACSLSGSTGGGKDVKPTATKQPAAARSGIALGEEFRSEGGGFAFKKVPSYEFTETIGILQIWRPGETSTRGRALY